FRGPLANLLGLLVDTLKVRLKDKNGPCISWSNIRDAMGKVSKQVDFLFQIEKGVNLALVFLAKTIISLNFIGRRGDWHFLGYAQLLFVWMKSHFRCLYKCFCQVFVPSTRPIKEFLESEWPPNQSIEECV
ncbi:hypothetical protein Goarm_011222, partial [Gossypium armourianum]|nr:hypothetical protein [Gossypium armourianum]